VHLCQLCTSAVLIEESSRSVEKSTTIAKMLVLPTLVTAALVLARVAPSKEVREEPEPDRSAGCPPYRCRLPLACTRTDSVRRSKPLVRTTLLPDLNSTLLNRRPLLTMPAPTQPRRDAYAFWSSPESGAGLTRLSCEAAVVAFRSNPYFL
jgi:hypothetical protein